MPGGGRRHQCITGKLDITIRFRATGPSPEYQPESVEHYMQLLLDASTVQYHRARLLAAAATHSGDWLSAVSSANHRMRTPPEWWARANSGRPSARYETGPGTSMHLRRDSRHQGLTRLLVQAQPRENPATSLHQRPSFGAQWQGPEVPQLRSRTGWQGRTVNNLKQLTYRSTLKHIIEYNFFYTICWIKKNKNKQKNYNNNSEVSHEPRSTKKLTRPVFFGIFQILLFIMGYIPWFICVLFCLLLSYYLIIFQLFFR